MADITIDQAKVEAEEVIEKSSSIPVGEALERGDYAIIDPASGRLVKGSGADAAGSRDGGLVLKGQSVVGLPAAILRKGTMWMGDALAALAFDSDVLLSDTGGLSATPADSTTGKVVGTVVPVFTKADGTADKMLRVDL